MATWWRHTGVHFAVTVIGMGLQELWNGAEVQPVRPPPPIVVPVVAPVAIPDVAVKIVSRATHGEAITEITQGAFVVRGDLFDQDDWTDDWGAGGGCRIVPAFRNGKAVGFKLFSIRPGSLSARLGIRNGDVVVAVNGLTLETPDRALEAYSTMKDAEVIHLEIQRAGQTVVQHYMMLKLG